MERYLTVKQASEICNVSERTIYRFFDKGLPRHQLTKHGRVLIKPNELENFIEQTDSPCVIPQDKAQQ